MGRASPKIDMTDKSQSLAIAVASSADSSSVFDLNTAEAVIRSIKSYSSLARASTSEARHTSYPRRD